MVPFVLTLRSLGELADQAGLPQRRSMVLERLDSHDASPFAINASEAIYPASMIKTPLVAAAFVDVADGRLDFEDRFTVTDAHITANDTDSPLVVNYESSLSEITFRAIAHSDNVATNMLFDILGRERATVVARERLALRATAFHRKLSGAEPLIVDSDWNGRDRNAHPACDAAQLFAAIARDEIPYAARLRASLAAQHWNEKLSLGLAPGDTFAHKTGDTDEVTHDGGILTTAQGRGYVIVVYTTFASNDDHNARLAAFMRALRPLL